MSNNLLKNSGNLYRSNNSMVLVKICGITNVEDAQLAVTAGADLLGLIFVSKSSRCVNVKQAQEIVHSFKLHRQVAMASDNVLTQISQRRPHFVGVFQNATAEEMNAIADTVGLDLIQLHGDEPPELPLSLNRPAVRAIGIHPDQQRPAAEIYRNDIEPHLKHAAIILLDTKSSQGFGGLGEHFDWSIGGQLQRDYKIPFILAGGLKSSNVVEAIRLGMPIGVDVASGVEQRPGIKDPKEVVAFIQAAKSMSEK